MNRLHRHILCAILVLAAASLAGAEPWPYLPFDQTHGVGNHYGEYQNYGGSAYYHDGIDLVTPSGPTDTYSVSDGTITHLAYSDPLYSGIMIGEPISGGEGWLYWHINSTTFQYDIGDQVQTNDYIGTTAYWTVYSFHHVHFNKVRGTSGYPWGWYESIENPLLLMQPNDDPDPPVFETTYNGQKFAFRRDGQSTVLDAMALSGNVDIVSRIKDIVGMSQWGLNPWRIDYWIDGATQSVAPTRTVDFSGHIPPDATVGVIYSTQSPLQTRGNYDQRIFYFILTNTDGDGFVESGDASYHWPTGSFAPGDYWVYARASDIGGNVVTDSMLCVVAGTVSPDISLPETSHDFGDVAQGQTATWDLVVRNLGTTHLSIREVTSSNFVFQVNRSHFFVPPGGEVPITVSFTPPMQIAYLGTITIKTNDADEPLLQVSLSGRGVSPAAAEEGAGAAGFAFLGARALTGGGLALRYSLDRPGAVEMEIYDAAGREVRGASIPGAAAGVQSWSWDGRDGAGRAMPSGVYFVRIRSFDRSVTGSGVLLR